MEECAGMGGHFRKLHYSLHWREANPEADKKQKRTVAPNEVRKGPWYYTKRPREPSGR